jgi:hypothetical protein
MSAKGRRPRRLAKADALRFCCNAPNASTSGSNLKVGKMDKASFTQGLLRAALCGLFIIANVILADFARVIVQSYFGRPRGVGYGMLIYYTNHALFFASLAFVVIRWKFPMKWALACAFLVIVLWMAVTFPASFPLRTGPEFMPNLTLRPYLAKCLIGLVGICLFATFAQWRWPGPIGRVVRRA